MIQRSALKKKESFSLSDFLSELCGLSQEKRMVSEIQFYRNFQKEMQERDNNVKDVFEALKGEMVLLKKKHGHFQNLLIADLNRLLEGSLDKGFLNAILLKWIHGTKQHFELEKLFSDKDRSSAANQTEIISFNPQDFLERELILLSQFLYDTHQAYIRYHCTKIDFTPNQIKLLCFNIFHFITMNKSFRMVYEGFIGYFKTEEEMEVLKWRNKYLQKVIFENFGFECVWSDIYPNLLYKIDKFKLQFSVSKKIMILSELCTDFQKQTEGNYFRMNKQHYHWKEEPKKFYFLALLFHLCCPNIQSHLMYIEIILKVLLRFSPELQDDELDKVTKKYCMSWFFNCEKYLLFEKDNIHNAISAMRVSQKEIEEWKSEKQKKY